MADVRLGLGIEHIADQVEYLGLVLLAHSHLLFHGLHETLRLVFGAVLRTFLSTTFSNVNIYSYFMFVYCCFKRVVAHTLKTVGVEQVLAFLVTFDAAFLALEALSSQTPQEALTLVAVGRMREVADLEVMWRCQRDRIDECLQCLFVHVHFLFLNF